ncbi:hypothetical protein CBR_g37220 [Chara braunii]|uniref:Mitochondrial carrier protein n=1 Tax=Chara braunii TaxID=69332 RepID=A0A388LMG2_CHABU|nr:hypothetical protein CBR_g37220 [Chara braunii]|eukprot:GBG83507.1 hypothetical protein CBR_g37220 [Chara braunii]
MANSGCQKVGGGEGGEGGEGGGDEGNGIPSVSVSSANGNLSSSGSWTYHHQLPTFAKELIAGGVSGGVAKTIIAPLERVKILFQTRLGNFQSVGVWRSLGHIFRTEGVLGFYRGNGANVVRVVPYAALHYMTYEQYRRWIIAAYGYSDPRVDLVAGSFAGATAVVCTYPLDLIRTRLALQFPAHPERMGPGAMLASEHGIRTVFTTVFQESGVKGLYRGIGPTLWGIFPYAGLKFYVYEALKGSIPGEPSVPTKLACGAAAGLVGQTVTYPLDVVRRQMQVQKVSHGQHNSSGVVAAELLMAGGPRTTVYANTWEGLRAIIQTQGWRQLYAGMSINYMKMVPAVAVGFTVYDGMKSWLQVPPRERHRNGKSSSSGQ